MLPENTQVPYNVSVVSTNYTAVDQVIGLASPTFDATTGTATASAANYWDLLWPQGTNSVSLGLVVSSLTNSTNPEQVSIRVDVGPCNWGMKPAFNKMQDLLSHQQRIPGIRQPDSQHPTPVGDSLEFHAALRKGVPSMALVSTSSIS